MTDRGYGSSGRLHRWRLPRLRCGDRRVQLWTLRDLIRESGVDDLIERGFRAFVALGLRLPGVSGVEGGGIRWHVDRVKSENIQRHEVEHAVVRRREDNRRSQPVVVCSQPIRSRHTPPIARNESRKPVLRHRCCQIIPDARLVFEEFASHHRADRVAAVIALIRVARSVAEEPGERLYPTRFEFEAENVQFHLKIPSSVMGPRPRLYR